MGSTEAPDETPPARVRAALDRLYAATQRFRPVEPVRCCGHCRLDESSHRLLQMPRESADAQLLDFLGFKAMTTWGGPDEFRYFLPRLLHLQCEGFPGAASFSLLAQKMLQAGFAGWPEAERTAVLLCLEAAWDGALDGSMRLDAAELYEAMAVLPCDAAAAWSQLLAAGTTPAVHVLCELVFAILDDEAMAQFRPLVRGPETTAALLRAAERVGDESLRDQVEMAFDRLQW